MGAWRTKERELWKLWSHQRSCALPAKLWSHQLCRGPLSLPSPQECWRTCLRGCQLHFVWQICQGMVCCFPNALLGSKISWYGLATISRCWGWCWWRFGCMNESIPDEPTHWTSPRQLCWSERHIGPFSDCWLWRYQRFIFQCQRHGGAKLRSTLLQCNLFMYVLSIWQRASSCDLRKSCTAMLIAVPLTAATFNSLC